MTYVLDASAVIDLLVRSDLGERIRELLGDQDELVLVTVSHLDAEVFSGLARLHRAEQLTADEVSGLIDRLGSLAMRRMSITAHLLRAAWGMRDNIAARDALYVAAAEGLQAKLVTTDERLARAVPHLAIP